MHYKNGREAKVGDAVVGVDWAGMPVSGIVVKTQAGSDTCNLYVAPVGPNGMPVYNADQFVHLDDAMSVPVPVVQLTGNTTPEQDAAMVNALDNGQDPIVAAESVAPAGN